jgi:hypothetical protein
MVTNSENAAQSQRKVWSNVHEALNHTVLSSIVSPSYGILRFFSECQVNSMVLTIFLVCI